MKILAKSLLQYRTRELWEMLTGEFTLHFDDGEVSTNYKEVLFSSYVWDLLREFPISSMKKAYFIQDSLDKGNYRANTHLKMLSEVVWDVYREHVFSHNQTKEGEWEFRKYLRRRVAEIYNLIYNDLSLRLEEYVTSLDILDLIEVSDHPKIKKANESVIPTQKSINKVYDAIQSVLNDPESLPGNAVGKIIRSGNANPGQINQCLGPRGFVTDIDSNIFRNPVLTSYLRGVHKMHDSLIDSRLAAKSLIFSKKPLQQAEFFSRRLQLMNQVVRNLHFRDCGSKHYLQWHVRGPHESEGHKLPGDLKNLRGAWYVKEDGTEDWIRGDEKELIGQTINLRNPIYCQDADRLGICSKCFGQLSFSTFKDCNIGQYSWTFVAEKSTQSVLSVKHYDGSSVVDSIYITEDLKEYLKVSAGGSSYLLSEKLQGKRVKLILHPENAEGINDIKKVSDIRKLNITRVTSTDEIGIEITDDIDSSLVSVPIGMRGRRGSFTYDFLNFVKEKGFSVNIKHNYVFDLEGWDWTKPFMVLPLKHYDMGYHSMLISHMIESSIDQMKIRDTDVSVDAFLTEFFDLVNTKLSVNIAPLSVVVLGIMVVSAMDENYSLPRGYTDSGLGVMRRIMSRRSLSALLAYQGQRDAIKDPISYIGQNRISHPFDDIVMPEEIKEK